MTKNILFQKIPAAFLFAFGCCAMSPALTHAQTVNPTDSVVQTTATDTVNQVQNFITDSSVVNNPNTNALLYPDFPDEVYASRLTSLASPIEVIYNDYVKSFITMYTVRKRDLVERVLGLSQIYFPVFEEVLAANQMPSDLKYLAVIESALNPSATSRCGAVGLWQFMYGTAKLYGLKINRDMDERRDIFKSTVAAATYLKNSYERYGNWLLAIASYNCGCGNVDRAIARAGGSHDFWTISRYLPAETRGYVPAFIAAMYTLNYFPSHNLNPQFPDFKYCEITTVPVHEKICFDKIAQYTNCSVDEIKFLNPGLNSNMCPVYDDQPYELKLPAEMLPVWDAMKDSIVISSRYEVPTYYSRSYGEMVARVHTVRRGQTLRAIASRYHVSASQLKSWNNIRGNAVRAGQRLTVYTAAPQYASAKASSKHGKHGSKERNATNVVYYKVRRGDTLWSIAKRKGISVTDIRANNSPAKIDSLRAGMMIKLVRG